MASFEPWSRSAQDSASEEGRLASLFGAIAEPEPLDDASRERVRRRLRGRAPGRAGVMLLRLVSVGVVLGVVGAAAAQWATERWLGARQAFVSAPAAPSGALVPQPALPRQLRPAPAQAAAPEAVEALEAAPAPRVASTVGSAAASAQSSRLGLEASSLSAALKELRGGAPQRALAALDRHLLEFPAGALELEARVARVDAQLLLGQRADARRALASLPIERIGRKQELRLIRAELTADEDCGRALADFQVLNEQSLPSAWAERALFGRAACLLKLGDDAGAARDFALYLERFPNGRFAAQVRARSVR